MADLISEVIDLQVFEQVKKLTADLETLYGVMDKTIALGAGNNKIIDPQGMKAATDATNNLNTTVTKLMETESERLNIERQIKAEGEKMAASVKIQSNAIEQAAAKYKMFSNSQKELAQYIMETDRRLAEIKTELKNADTSASNYAEATANLKIEQAKLKAELSEATKELKRTGTEQKFADDSMKGMSVRLLQLKDLYSQFTETERNSEFGQTISQGINELDEKLKGLDKSIGDNQRSVGEYEVAGKSLRAQIMDIVNDLGRQKIAYREIEQSITKQRLLVQQLTQTKGSEAEETKLAVLELSRMEAAYKKAGLAINQLEQQGGKLQDVYSDTRRSIKGVADDAGNTKAVAEGIGVLGNSFQMFQAGMVALGAEGEEMNKIFMKMMVIQQGVNSLTQITNALESESVLRLKLKAIWDKVALAFTEKKTAATVAQIAVENAQNAASMESGDAFVDTVKDKIKTIAAETIVDKTQAAASQAQTVAENINTTAKKKNIVSTAGAATATAGLATAEGVATTTSWTLVGSLKAVGAAIKSIPVIGWILAAVAALGTLTVLLYKHLSAEKELTAEQQSRKAIAESMRNVQKKVTEETTETVIRLQMYLKGLEKAKQGSKEWNSIVKDIAELTGKTRQEIGNSTKDIKANTSAWIEQYVARATAEAKLQEIIDNNIKMAEIERDIKSRSVYEDEDALDAVIKKMNLTKEDEKFLRKNLDTLYETTEGTEKNAEAWGNINDIIGSVSLGIKTLNNQLTKQINLTDLISNDNENNKETMKSYQNEILKLRAELYLTGEELLRENTRIELAISEKKYQDELKQLREKNQSTEELEQLHQLELVKIQQDGFAKIQELRQKNFEDSVNWNVKQQEENDKTNQQFIDQARDAQNMALEGVNKYMSEQEKILQKQIDLNKQRVDSIYELTDAFGSLGSAIAGNIKDEKKRVLVEQRVAEAQLLVMRGLAIAQVLLDPGGDPYTKIIRVAANLAVIIAGFVQAEAAISQAKGISAYAEGTDYHRGGGAIIGEGGQPELLQVNGRSSWITEPTYFPSLPVGASVTPLDDMQQDNREVELLQKLYDKEGSMVKIDVSGKILPTLIKDGRVIRFSNKLIEARG